MSKKTSSAMWLLGAGGMLFLINAIAKAKAESTRKHLMTYGFGVPASGTIKVPTGKRWQVELRNGDRLTMTSAQLQNAIDSHAVKTYQEISTQA